MQASLRLDTCPSVILTYPPMLNVPLPRRYLDRLGEDKYLMALKNLCDAGGWGWGMGKGETGWRVGAGDWGRKAGVGWG